MTSWANLARTGAESGSPAETRPSIALQVLQCIPKARRGRSTRDKVIYVRICNAGSAPPTTATRNDDWL
jgi:hypothetical protein